MLPASSGPTARHAMTVGSPIQKRVAGLLMVVFVAGCLYAGIFPYLGRMPAAALASGRTVVGLASVWLLFRAWRMGVRFDDRGIAVRNLWRTNRFALPPVSCLADGALLNQHDRETYYWALKVMLHDSRSVTAWWMSYVSHRFADPAMLDQLKLAAARFDIAALLTGAPAIKVIQPSPP